MTMSCCVVKTLNLRSRRVGVAQLFLCRNQFFLQARIVSFAGLHILSAFGFPLDQLRQCRPLSLGDFGCFVTKCEYLEQASSQVGKESVRSWIDERGGHLINW
jgi:hypothetical protein